MANQPDYEVVVIGAGVAGLAAAQRLRAAGLEPLVVEARERVGGRIWTDHTVGPIELGAEFIHGERAATWQIVNSAGLATEPWPLAREMLNDDQRRYAQHGVLLPLTHPLARRFDQLYDSVEQYDGPEQSVQEVVLSQAGPADEAGALVLNRLACMEAADVSRLSARGLAWERAQNSAGWENFHICAGYDALPALLAEGLRMQMGTAVTEVAWNDTPVRLSLSNGQTIQARQVIITAPLGLLQADCPHFVPALPAWKQQAIQALAMGHVTKLVLRFSRRVWPLFSFLSTDGMVLTWWPVGSQDQPALMGYNGGPAALELAGLGQERAIAQGLAELTQLFGPELQAAFRGGRLVDWSIDPWSRGAYSYIPVGAGQARADLAAPLPPVLFFAGEATSTNGHAATVHGAIESGWRAAEELLHSR